MLNLSQLYHLPYIDPVDFPEFAVILAGDDEFPATYAAWDNLLNATEKDLWRDGNVPIFTGVTPTGFRQFVAVSTASASINALIAYAALLRSTPTDTVRNPSSDRDGPVLAALNAVH